MTEESRYLADFSLALINRTGAYYVCRDVVAELSQGFAATRYWRMLSEHEPQGLLRKLMGRAMLAELSLMPSGSLAKRRRFGGLPTLYFDPLYVLHSDIDSRDIVLCHDVGPISHTHLFDAQTTRLYERAYRRIKDARPGMVFVSVASRDAFAALFGTDYRFMTVIPLYVRSSIQSGSGVAPPGVKPPFFLTIAAMETRKNYQNVIAAFERSGLREKGYSYIFCGPNGNAAEEVRTLANVTPGVQRLGYLSDEELLWLYQHATAFVLPSLLEGFGVPPLEAALHGLISIVSRDGAQREAVGESGILVDPLSVDDIARGMCEVVAMPAEERARRARLARAHADSLTKQRYVASWSELLNGSPAA